MVYFTLLLALAGAIISLIGTGFLVRAIRAAARPPAPAPEDVVLLREIRDSFHGTLRH